MIRAPFEFLAEQRPEAALTAGWLSSALAMFVAHWRVAKHMRPSSRRCRGTRTARKVSRGNRAVSDSEDRRLIRAG